MPILDEKPWGGRMSASRAHVAVVLVHRRGDHEVVWPHDRRRALYRLPVTAYDVDLGRHTMTIDVQLPSHDRAFPFHASAGVEWRVLDPSAVVRYQVTDVRKIIAPELTRRMRRIARNFDVEHAAEAEDAINTELGAPDVDLANTTAVDQATADALKHEAVGSRYGLWTSTIVALSPDEKAAAHYATLQQIHWDIEKEKATQELRILQEANQGEITQSRMSLYRKTIERGDAELFVLQLAHNPQDIAQVLTLFREEKEAKRRNFIDFVSRMIDSRVVERWQVSDQARVALEWLKEEISGVIPDRKQRNDTESAYRFKREGRSKDNGDSKITAVPAESTPTSHDD